MDKAKNKPRKMNKNNNNNNSYNNNYNNSNNNNKINKTIATKIAIMILIVITLTTIIGCGGQSTIEEVNYFEGTEGITFKLVENSPPEKVYAGEPLSVMLEVHNKGAWDIAEQYVARTSVSVDPLYFTDTMQEMGLTDNSEFTLYGRSPYWPAGQEDFISVAYYSSNSLGPRKGAKVPILINVCYPYQTTLQTPICIDMDPHKIDEGKQVCNAEDLSFSSQGSPVAVTYIDYESLPGARTPVTVTSQAPALDEDGAIIGTNEITTTEYISSVKPMFRITLENVGDGQVVSARGFEEQRLCEVRENSFPSNTLLVRAKLGNTNLKCYPEFDEGSYQNVITEGESELYALTRLIDETAEVTCVIPEDEKYQLTTNYIDFLQVEAAFVYRNRESKEIEIIDDLNDYTPPAILAIECEDLDLQEDRCKLYANSKSCAWCSENNKCLPLNACETGCEQMTEAYEETHMCVEPCNNIAKPIVIVKQPTNSGTVEFSCVDPKVAGKTVDKNRCGCDKEEFYYMFVRTKKSCTELEPLEERFEQETAQYDTKKKQFVVTKQLHEIPIQTKIEAGETGTEAGYQNKFCAYVKAKTETRSDVKGINVKLT